ncbi:MAG: SRPBCC domain-containing protein [Geodermatophilaceae bacterium]
MTQAEAAVVRDQVVVDAPLTQAFAVFTERFGDFKPPEHNLLGAEIAETVFEPRVGGHIYDRAVDGTECRWARVLAYEPPNRVVFSWDISPQWQIETDPDHTSEVEVVFIAEAPRRTALSWNTATSTGTDPAGRPSAKAWAGTPDGRCTWLGTRPS